MTYTRSAQLLAPLALTLGTALAAASYRSVHLTLTHGAGDLSITRHDNASPTLKAPNVRVQSGVALVSAGREVGDWALGLSPATPVSLKVRHNAGDIRLDLRGLNVPSLALTHTTGDVKLALGTAAMTGTVAIGQGDLMIKVPSSVGLRVQSRLGQGYVKFQGRALKEGSQVNDAAQTDNYATAHTRVILNVTVDTGSVTVQ
ncbi:hypothetical protein GCM10008955_37800 [Deinococcus malanensis]|uniref:Adhesin domain-containing protein n=1 Tax=Deinococcus malanensis TaxID=1706855 RepID=A0ABQ2F184_9DEIO|nr:DUF4097 family beta strand repeat-containing protein [Deinococcus malanensis]GGK40445.1 hypothetical protein GCM10008955_37800 [Deinococcus malanensis]